MNELLTRISAVGVPLAAATFLLLIVAERRAPLRERRRPYLPHLARNLALSVLALGVGVAITGLFALDLADWTQSARFGLLAASPLPFWAQFALGFLLLDLTFYYWHMANHRVPLLWRFHNMHHIDPDLDVSTSFRFHPGEVAISSGFRAAQIALLGVAPMTYVVYGLAFQFATMFHHSNVKFPIALERVINAVAVTPRMHGVHHSAVRAETDSNYGVIFRWWDWLHRTLCINVRHAAIIIGVSAYQEPDDNRLARLLAMPFAAQRPYWRFADGRPATDTERGAEPGTMAE